MELNYFRCYYSYRKKLENLSDQEVGHLFRAVLQYGETGAERELTERESVAFDFIADDIDREKAAYRRRCEANARNGARGGRPPKRAIERVEHNPANPVGFQSLSKATRIEPQVVSLPSAIMLPLNDGTEYAVPQELVQEFSSLYPAVDVMQQLREMRGWLIANPTNRKTKRGILRFVTGWLGKQQDIRQRDAGRNSKSQGFVYSRGEDSL